MGAPEMDSACRLPVHTCALKHDLRVTFLEIHQSPSARPEFTHDPFRWIQFENYADGVDFQIAVVLDQILDVEPN